MAVWKSWWKRRGNRRGSRRGYGKWEIAISRGGLSKGGGARVKKEARGKAEIKEVRNRGGLTFTLGQREREKHIRN